MGLIKKLYEKYVGKEKLTEPAVLAGHVFDEDTEGELFFDTVLARFENFDQVNHAQGNKVFSNDVDFIIQCATTSLLSSESLKKFSSRIDSYLYIYRRIEEYFLIVKRSSYLTWGLESNVKQLKDKLFESLSQVFIKDKGLQPNLCTKDKDQLKRMNIVQHLMSLTKVDKQTMNIFLVLCKLSFQSSVLIEDHLQWKHIISNIQHFGVTLQEFVSNYIDYQLAFREFPFDLSGFIELTRKNHPSKHSQESPFIIFLRLCKGLNLKIEEFFEQYRAIFDNGIKQKLYTFPQIGEFLKLVGRHDRIFDLYFSTYAASVDLDDLWTMFIYICTNSELNEIIQKHLISKLSDRTTNASIEPFLRYTKLAKQSVTKIKEEYRPRFITIFEKIFDAFVSKQLNDERYSHQFSNSDLKEFLNIGLEMSSTHYLHQPSCLFIIRRLLFQNDTRSSNIAEKIKGLFKKINDFDQDLCENNDPTSIIQDEWLQNFLLVMPEDFLYNFNQSLYQYLCDNHQNNRWTIYIWKRLIYLSILKSKIENTNDMLLKLNDWMKVIKHNVYDINDTLTIILVINLFELIIVKYTKSVLLLPNIESIVNFIFHSRREQLHQLDTKQVDEFIENGLKSIQHILLLQDTCSNYRELLRPSIVYCFLQFTDVKQIITSVNPQQYKFPPTTSNIECIMPNRPKDINITQINAKEQYFQQLIEQVNEWLRWFDKFLLVFSYVIEWLKNWNVDGAAHLFNDMHTTRDSSSITIIQMKTIVERTLKLLRPFNDLRRLCHLFNCLTSFQLIDSGGLNNQIDSANYIRELKRFQPTNSFTVEAKIAFENIFNINDRQNVQWYIACEKLPCNIKIKYQTTELHGDTELLFDKEKLPIDKNILQGEFETQRAGQLTIVINNEHLLASRTIWYRIKQTPLSTCHLFHGIFNMYYQSSYIQPTRTISEAEFSKLLGKVFTFIDNLLNGTVSLGDMADLKAVFCDKNIHIREEVKKLFTNRSSEGGAIKQRTTMAVAATNIPTDKEIEQVCEWLQIYQYYSHINIIINCIETFNILPAENDDELIGHLKRLRDENCSLREITEAYKILKQQFQKLTSQHLQLIKTALECSAVVLMMKKSDLYSPHGRRRFQELRDNLTTQFQLQERNNMILNSWIIAYELCEPFVHKARSFADFIDRIARLLNFEEKSIKHMQTVNENLQMVNMWLSAEETTVLDNALITMEHLYKTGTVKICLRRLMNEQSYFEIGYSINKIQTEALRRIHSEDDEHEQYNDDEQEQNKAKILKFTLLMSDVDDHKRQLTFCNVDLQENMLYKKILLNEQLKLLKIVENIYAMLVKLEMAGHPEYQLREEVYEIHDRTGEIDAILSDLRNDHRMREDRLKRSVKTRTDNLELIYRTFEIAYTVWMRNLELHRQENPILNLFSNRQIMILVILLTTSTTQNQIKCHFLEKLSLSKDVINNKEKELKLTIQCLTHYLHSLKINEGDLSEANVLHLYETYKIESNSNADTGLKKLSQFLRHLFQNNRELFQQNRVANGNQQYLVTPNMTRYTSETIPLEHDLDMDTCCVLLNLFNNRLPSVYQILWCSIATEDDIHLFFSRVRTFCSLIFVVMDIDKMHHRLREVLLNEQDALTRQDQSYGSIYYFSRELTTSRKGLRPFHISPRYRDSYQTYRQLVELFQQNNLIQPQIQIIYGAAGIGKTHCINTKYKNQDTYCFSINDTLNLSSLISSFLSFDSRMSNDNLSVSFNISIHAPFEELNRTLLSLFICGSLTDTNTGLTFSLPENKQWKFFIEVPHTDKYHMTIKENFDQILPVLSILSPYTLEEITDKNYQLYIGEEEELVARFLKAYENRTIDRQLIITTTGKEQPVDFEPLTNHDECRNHIYNCIKKEAPELPRNKISELSFTKFLYRRIRFFTGHYYRFNMTFENLGSTAMEQMINEAKSLAQIDFRHTHYPRVYLVYDPYFSLHLLHDDWNNVPRKLKRLFKEQNPSIGPEFKNKNYFAKCLSWLIDIKYEDFIKIMNETKFILTENFTYKLFHVHERKLTKLSLIIEGDTGVGKTFLLKFYSSLLNSNIINAPIHDNVAPRIRERLSLWLLTAVIIDILENETNLLNAFLYRVKPKLMGLDDEQVDRPEEANILFRPQVQLFEEDDDENPFNESLMQRVPQPIIPPAPVQQVLPPAELVDIPLLKEIKISLETGEYDNDILQYIWKTIMIISSENAMNVAQKLITALHEYVTTQLVSFPLIEASFHLQTLLKNSRSPTVQTSIEIFNEYLVHTQIKSLFHRLLLHPGVTEEQLESFMSPICQLARELPDIELVVFFDEVNTSSCLGLFKEMFMDRTLHGNNLPKNIFFTAAINPSMAPNDDNVVHRRDYLVHQLPQALENLKVSYGALESTSLRDYILKKINTFHVDSSSNHQTPMPLEEYAQEMLAESILNAQDFCEKYLGRNSVSQREIQRCFNLIEFFWKMRFDDEIDCGNDLYQPNPIRCIALALALIYYFRLPTDEDNTQRKDDKTPPREKLAALLSRTIPNFVEIIQHELDKFVNTDNFIIPHGVAINQAVREHIFSIVVSIVTRTPLCIIGAPGQSKTLSFQIVLQNLQGSQLSMKPFCKRLPAIDPFFCLGSKYSRSEDIAYIFDRALKREQQYEQNRMNTRCVVFLDEASLPDEKKMVLKVLHPYLDECKVAFVAVANKSFDAANANRMICVYRSLPSADDQKILAYGCLGLQIKGGQQAIDKRLEMIIYGLCQGYRRILNTPSIPHIYHDRDFIYMLRELRFELTTSTDDQETRIAGITPVSLLRALEDNFNGIKKDEFEQLLEIFFQAVQEQCPGFKLPSTRRNVPTILQESMKLDSMRRRLHGRYKLIIDESEDESAVRLLSQSEIINLDPNRTTVFRMSDFPDDVHNELRNVEILSTIKLCMETGKTILMVNTGRIHGSLYDVFNQNFSIMATGDMRKIFSKVAIGPKTIDVVVHEDFQCIVHVKRSEFKDIPAPFLSRFQKYSLGVNDFYRIQFEQLSIKEQIIMKNVEEKLHTFIKHFGRQYFYGLNDDTLYSCLLSLIKYNENEQNYFLNVHQHYTQLTITSKPFIEQNSSDIQQCLLRSVLSKLLQLVSPESIILKLPTFEDKLARWLCTNYFHQQEHFHIENFIQKLISNPSIELQNDDLLTTTTTTDTQVQKLNDIRITRKIMIFTRTSSYVIGLNEQSKYELFGGLNDNTYTDNSENIEIINLAVIENSVELEEKFQMYEKNEKKKVLIIVVNARSNQQRLHILYVRQLIDKTEYSCNVLNKRQEKYFVMLVHSPAQELYHQSSFPSIFLHDWDFYFFDSCAPGSAFHLQKMLQILSSSFDQQQQESFDNTLCDLNTLFDDCLWDFCSRIQIVLQELPKDTFKNKFAYEFYQSQTNTLRRVQCLKQILQRSAQLQKRIVTIYHDHLSNKKDSSKKIYNLIYQISKDILCGKRFDGLVESIQSQTRISFTNFVSNVFKFIVNDYGLDTLSTLSSVRNGYDSMLELIDYSSFATDNDKDNLSPITQGLFQLVSHYACIPQTPLYHLFHQRIKSCADEIKLTRILKQTEQKEKEDVPRRHYYAVPSLTTVDNNSDDENETTNYTFEEFRYKLMKSILNDKVLSDIINEHILESYSNDLVRTFCTIVEKNFDDNLIQCHKTIEFVSRWLLLVDDDDRQSLEDCPHKHIWLLAHVYASFEYDQNDLFSLYSACRITDRLDLTRSFYANLFIDNHVTRSEVREILFRLMFDYLWKNLCEFCSNNDNSELWIETYTFISKYYPSDKVLQRLQLIEIKDQIEFMNLAYLILLNDKTPEPKDLVSHLLKDIHLVYVNNNAPNRNYGKSTYLKLLPKVIDSVQQYLERKDANKSTLMIDLQQWIITMLKSSTESCKEEISNIFKDLNQLSCRLSLPMKQFLFDQLANLYLESIQNNRHTFDCWERVIRLLPFVVECVVDDNLLEEYQLPYHPSITVINDQRQTLLDLFFFHLQRYLNDETIKCDFVKKIIQSALPNTRNRRPTVTKIFDQLKHYFLLRSTALLLCQTDVSLDDQRSISRITQTIITTYLSINREAVQFSQHLHIFLSTIISKRSWNFLFNLLKSEHIQRLNSQWATTLCDLLETKQTIQRNEYLQLCHQIQFTLSTNNTSSIFPKLHQSYEQLRKIVNDCVNGNLAEQRWKNLSDWIESKVNANPPALELKEIKVMLLLNIYYDYYCNNQLASVSTLLPFIENTLQPLPEELRVFRAFLQPEQFMIGYPRRNDNAETNFLNNLFTLDCKDEDELGIRHSLVNLLAMILMGNKQSFLWTFVFNPLTLQNTYGFGSTSRQTVQTNGVHYDCGCIISQNGDLMHFERVNPSALNVPAVYVAYFSTFGALAWHLLLFNESVQNLHGPILAPHAIADNTAQGRIAGNNNRTKVCHFVRARLLSTFNFLSIRSNRDDACILLNRCFEQMAFLTINHQQAENSWIKPIFNTINDQLKAEQEYQNQVFYFVHQKLAEHKVYVNQLNLQSQIQTNLQEFITQMPITLQFIDFRTELHNPINSQLPLKILRYVLDSTDFLKITKWIYDLSQFYLLLHQTYTQLVERDEFHDITLNELYNRGQKHSNEQHVFQHHNRNNNYSLIIDNGIQAVNAYHEFADGLIRPGVCDQTQRFSKITRETPIHYLVTTANLDEGNIIMRILSVLVDYHNNLLNLLKKEADSDDNHVVGALKSLINDLTSKEVSILQIVRDNTGVITLTDNDCLWIEQLSRAILINENDEYFQKADTQFNFDFLYLQSYIIRTYLLLCRINYQHVIQNYQCYVRRTQLLTDGETLDLDEKYCIPLNRQQLETDWNHLKEMYLDKLYHGHNLLRQIVMMLKHHQEDLSQINLSQFIQSLGNDNIIREQIEQYEIKDFQLCHIDHIRKLYSDSISDFQHLFTDVSQSLRTPIDPQLDIELSQMLQAAIISIDYGNNVNKIQSTIQIITDLLNDLRSNERLLLGQWARQLKETCDILNIENSILDLVPDGIKCENYVALSIHLIRMRTILQERVVNIEEKETEQWDENIDVTLHKQQQKQTNRFHDFLIEPSLFNETSENLIDQNDQDIWPEIPNYIPTDQIVDNLLDGNDLRRQHQFPTTQQAAFEEHFEYSSLFELNLKFVPLTSSTLFEQIHKQPEESPAQAAALTKAQKFIITYPNGEPKTRLWKSENLLERLRNISDTEKYDVNKFAVIDKNEILVDFTNNNARLPNQISLEYFIIEKTSLFSIQFHFQTKIFEYFATSKSNISIIIDRFISDNDIKSSSTDIYLCFFDKHGKTIDNVSIADLINPTDQHQNKTISITVIEENNNTTLLCEVTLRSKQGQEQISLFHPTTKWQQINQWLTNFTEMIDSPINEYAYFDKEQKTIIEESQSISLVLEQTKLAIVDGISRDATTKVIFSYENNSTLIYALKSMRICHLLNNERLLRKLNLIDISPNDCVLVLGETNEKVLSQDDIRQPVGNYYNTIDQPIHFRISISIQILKYDKQQPLQILLSNRNTTIEHIFQMTHASPDVYKYLASNYTKKILDFREKLSNLIDTKFILVKEHETCLVSIEKPRYSQLIDIGDGENEIHQRFTIFATIADICRENQIDSEHRYLLYSDDFVPSTETQLIYFQSVSPIRFTLIDSNLPVTVTIQNNEDKRSIKFHCSLTITVKRLSSIACQLFGVNSDYYKLMQVECLLDDDDVTLNDIDSAMTEIQFQLISTASINSSIRYEDQTVLLPCRYDTSAATLILETLRKLHIPQKNRHMYELIALADDRTPIEQDMSIEDVYQLFSSLPTTIPFELTKTDT